MTSRSNNKQDFTNSKIDDASSRTRKSGNATTSGISYSPDIAKHGPAIGTFLNVDNRCAARLGTDLQSPRRIGKVRRKLNRHTQFMAHKYLTVTKHAIEGAGDDVVIAARSAAARSARIRSALFQAPDAAQQFPYLGVARPI